jgi:hypothetical protein
MISFKQTVNLQSESKKLSEIQIQSMSLINRLIQTTNKQIGQTQLYSSLIKSINEHKKTQKNNDSDVFFNTFKDFEFVTLNQCYEDANLAGSNWFFNLIRVFIYKSNNSIYDCLLFQLLKKICVLVPRLFVSLFSNDVQIKLFHETLNAKLSLNASSTPQLINSICEFLCAVIDYQPSFFQLLAQLETTLNSHNEYSFAKGDMSVLKSLFSLLECKLDKVCRLENLVFLQFES